MRMALLKSFHDHLIERLKRKTVFRPNLPESVPLCDHALPVSSPQSIFVVDFRSRSSQPILAHFKVNFKLSTECFLWYVSS